MLKHKVFINSIGMCRMRQFLAVLRSFFHSSPLCTFSCHTSPPTILPSSLTPSCHLFLGLPLNLVVPKFIYNTLLGILFSSILCTCPNQCYYYYWYSALGPVSAETRAQSGDWYGSGMLHSGQVLRGRLPLLSPAFFLDVPTFHHEVSPCPP